MAFRKGKGGIHKLTFVRPPLEIRLQSIAVRFNPRWATLEEELEKVNTIIKYYIEKERQNREIKPTANNTWKKLKRDKGGKFTKRVRK